MTKIITNIYRNNVERDLRDYPYLLMLLETELDEKDNNYRKVYVIKKVLESLDKTSKILIEEWYFKGELTQKQIEKKLAISTATYYKLRNSTLRKFGIALGYLSCRKRQ